jgi:hypothetical protein
MESRLRPPVRCDPRRPSQRVQEDAQGFDQGFEGDLGAYDQVRQVEARGRGAWMFEVQNVSDSELL